MLSRYDHVPTVMRRHSIEPTVFVLSKDDDEELNIMAAGWNAKCSYDPPMMAVALSKDGHTHELIKRTGEFVLAVPSPGQKELLEYVGSVSGADIDKFAQRDIKTQPSAEISVPLLSDARANFECKVKTIVQTGDHFLFIGNVVAAYYNAGKDQLYYAGRNPEGDRVFQDLATHFPEATVEQSQLLS